MKITWYGHSCFKVETEAGSVVFDPYSDGSVPGYGALRLKADMVLCSHTHNDHGNRGAVELSGREAKIQVEKVNVYHDDVKGAKRGLNTIHIIQAEGMRIAHLGDIGCDIDDEQTKILYGVDVLMIPIGGFYTINAQQALEIINLLQPRVVIPMHYRDDKHGYDVISTSDEFRVGCRNPKICGSQITVDKNTAPYTALMCSHQP